MFDGLLWPFKTVLVFMNINKTIPVVAQP